MNAKENDNGFVSSIPTILLASDSQRAAEHLHRTLKQEGFAVQLVPAYHDLDSPGQHQNVVVLLEISSLQSVEAAVAAAMRLKRLNAGQFVGYIVDPILHTSGLAGDAIFPRSTHHLPQALRDFFRGQPISSR
jgi:hypothetical protein